MLSNKKREAYSKVSIIFNYAPNTPRAFIRYEEHKDSLSMQPIVNKKQGPTYSLEKYMIQIYKVLPESKNSL